jgi:hypothetical protein
MAEGSCRFSSTIIQIKQTKQEDIINTTNDLCL